MTLAEFVKRYPPRSPAKPVDHPDEARPIGVADGVLELTGGPPSETPIRSSRPAKKGDIGCHLWLVLDGAMPYIDEDHSVSPPMQSPSGRIKHTNLSGGATACTGGELWVDLEDPGLLYVNGCSGRYAPRSRAELAELQALLEARGYRVVSFGWSADRNAPSAVLVR